MAWPMSFETIALRKSFGSTWFGHRGSSPSDRSQLSSGHYATSSEDKATDHRQTLENGGRNFDRIAGILTSRYNFPLVLPKGIANHERKLPNASDP